MTLRERRDHGSARGASQPGWTSIYSEAVSTSNELLPRIGRRFLCLPRGEAASRTIHLPPPADVYDLVRKKGIARNAAEFRVNAPPRSTEQFYYGTRAGFERGSGSRGPS